MDFVKFSFDVITVGHFLVLSRLHQSADHQINHTASAILRQSICQVFDRIQVKDTFLICIS